MSTLKTARAEHRRISLRFGGGMDPYILGQTHKTDLAPEGFTQVAAHLLPARESIRFARELGVDTTGWRNLCKGSTRGCRTMCLTKSGRLAMDVSQRAAFVRSYIWQTDLELFEFLVDAELLGWKRRIGDDVLVCRIYGTHDGQVERDLPNLVRQNPEVIFNDYTKLDIPTGWAEPNVYRIVSGTEFTTAADVQALVEQGLNITIPFDCKKGELPTEWHGARVVSGDDHDLRFLDPSGVVVGLAAKRVVGHTVADSRGFIHPVPVAAPVTIKAGRVS